MSSSVSGILGSNASIVDSTPGLKEKETELNGLISETDRHLQGQLDTGEEITGQKTSARKKLELTFRKVSNAVVAHAVVATEPAVKSLGDKHTYSDTYYKVHRQGTIWDCIHFIW